MDFNIYNNIIELINMIPLQSLQILNISFIVVIVGVAINFWKLNHDIKYIKRVVIKITKKMNIELFDIDK